MRWFTLVAIYFLFWFIALFAVLPFSARTAEEAGEKVLPGHADSAPHQFRAWTVVWRTSLISAILLGLFYMSHVGDWIDVQISAAQAGHIP